MKRSHWFLVSFALAGIAAFVSAQEPGVPQPPPAKPEEPKPAVYSNQGKPIKIDFNCKDDDIQNFGLTCTEEEPCEAFLELAAVEANGNRLLLTGNIHTSNVTLWSVLLSSEDAGKTWTEAWERQRSTSLDQIQFADFEIGWISGHQLISLPRDPFFLITNDGGKTWRRRPIFGETRVGAVEIFAFENRTNGELLIDRTQSGDSGGRHEYYESNTGGDTWSLREVSPKPLKLKRPKAPSAEWRIRPDAATKSFRVEQRAGARWNNIAGFAVNVGACQPAATTLVEPPPTPEEDKGVFKIESMNPKAPPSLKKKKKR
ncbi:MAG: exo-alpha-sialidase [Acidobacteria bacterium]|nr:exo-alpha-sialidase [Acidobacteriota bacterium]